ncbi:MAG: polysaccharide biosynthesis/export family protein [Bacteroidetes bacterium]|nr:polysaccharide biosynthesis/export family protein [Bacteroidota bacterium]
MFQKFLLLLFAGLFVSSCALRKNTIYFQEKVPSSDKNGSYSPIFKKNDFLAITVYSTNADATTPFNLASLNSASGGASIRIGATPGYLVDQEGNINFPVLGKIQVLGLSKIELIDLLQSKLSVYLDKPIVLVNIQNFKVTVLGTGIGSPGTLDVTNEKITLPEALSLSGDLTITGKRQNVRVIRDRNGVKSEYVVDLTKSDLFASDVYYLEQNDIVYVEGNQVRYNISAFSVVSGLFFTITSVVITSIALFNK